MVQVKNINSKYIHQVTNFQLLFNTLCGEANDSDNMLPLISQT